MKTKKIGLPPSNPNDWIKDNAVNVPGVSESIIEPLYDAGTYPGAGAASLLFFQDPLGGVNGKTLSDTNMDLPGQLSAGKRFKVTAISVEFFHDNNLSNSTDGIAAANFIDDVRTFAENGALIFKIQSKDYLRQAPLGKFPAPQRFGMDVVSAGANAAGNNLTQYTTTKGRLFSITPKVLRANQNFSIELINLPALPSGIDARIMVKLWGVLGRNAQ